MHLTSEPRLVQEGEEESWEHGPRELNRPRASQAPLIHPQSTGEGTQAQSTQQKQLRVMKPAQLI